MSPQIGRIARLLHVDPSEVHGLDGVPDADLRILHDQISRALFAEGQQRFARIAGLSKTIPGPLAGVLAEKFLPPVMAARVSEMLDPAKARDLIGRVSIKYLAEIALALDPVKSRPVVQKLPPEPIGKVAAELFGREEYATMAEFVGTVTVDALFAAFEVATPYDLLAVVPLLEWNESLDQVVADLPHRKVTEIATALTAVELADLALALDPSRMGPIVAAVPLVTVEGIAAELFARGEYAGMARFVGVVTPEMVHAVLADLPNEHVQPMVAELTPTELAELALVLDPALLGPIVEDVPADAVGEIARVLFGRNEYAGMARFVGVVTEPMLHAALGVASSSDLLALAPLLDWNERVDAVFEELPAAMLDTLLTEIVEGPEWDEAKVTFERLSPTVQQRLFDGIDRLSPANRATLQAAASAGELGEAAAALMAQVPR